MASKKKTKDSKSRGARGRAKFAGTVEVTPPDGDGRAAIANGTRVVASIAELSVSGLPESGDRSELQLDVGVRTTSAKGAAVSGVWSSGTLYYVPQHARLNIEQAVIFDGEVHQHLSLDLSLVERELVRMDPADAAALTESAATAAAELVGISGPLGNALEAFPGIVGGILRLNGDDQVLKYVGSWLTREVRQPAERARPLVEGSYRFEKKRRPGDDKAWVTLVVDVRRVD
jgi:hypothetical protein